MKYIRFDIHCRKIGIRSGILSQKSGIRNGYVVEASMARPRPKIGHVHPPGPYHYFINRLNALTVAEELITFGEVFYTLGPKDIRLCVPNVT